MIRHYSTNDGFPSSTIYHILQDKDGFIWFGTDMGVTRFDGKKFHNYSLPDGLSDNYILKVKQDSKDRIWFLGFNGTVSYWLHGKIYNSDSDTLLKKIKSSNSFVDLFEDRKNRLWFSSLQGYVILDKIKITNIDHIYYAGVVMNRKSGQIILSPTLPFFARYENGKISSLQLKYKIRYGGGYWRFKDESILFASEDGIVKQKDTLQKLIVSFDGEFGDVRLGSMVLASDSLLWLTTMGKGLYCYNLKDPLAKPVSYLRDKITTSVMEDKEGNIWVSTSNEGLFMFPVYGKNINLINQESGLKSNQCYALNKTNTDDLMVGISNGEIQSVSNYNISDKKIPKCDEVSNKVNRIVSRNDDIWIASECGLIHQNNMTGCNHFINYIGAPTNSIHKIPGVKDISLREDTVYFIGNTRIVKYPALCPRNAFYPKLNRNEVGKRTYSLYCDYSNRLWYADINGLHSQVGNWIADHSKEDILLTQRINCMAEIGDSTLVLATHGYGILLYKNGKIINQVTVAKGLCNDICRKVFVHRNRIYVATPTGVSVLFYSKGKVQSIQNLNTGNFLPSNDVNDVFADDVDVSVATMEGVVVIGNWALAKINRIIPPLHLTEIRVNNKLISSDEDVTLTYTENSLKFNFIGMHYQMPNAVNYRYRLKKDQDWQTTKSTKLEFSFLPPGHYIFQLQARIEDGSWSPMKNFVFTIIPPFWRTIWFGFLTLMAIGFIVYLIVRQRLKTIRKQHEDEAKIVKQITDLEQQALQTMMNPHFIFNVMNAIQHFINDNNREAANRYLTDFATLIRMNLTISYKRFIPLDEEIEYLNLYLSFEKLRFGDNLTYEINVDPAIDCSETTIAVMMIQPFIENAVWHGILPMNAKGHIHIQIDKVADDLIKVTIEDNGVGINEKFITGDVQKLIKESHALSMTLQRLTLLGKSSGHELYIRYKHAHPEQENKGTIAELLLPATFY